jgi:hypothetical protein
MTSSPGSGAASGSLLESATGAPVPERARQIQAAAQRCARVVRNLLALARQHPPERADVSLKTC